MTRTAFVLLLGMLAPAGGCKERNPAYCDGTAAWTCPDGQQCDVEHRRCFDPAAPDSSIGCEQSSDCPVAAPICESQDCTPCLPGTDGDADCAARDPGTPLCAADGRCVGCITSDDCSGSTPVCDLGTGSCRACADHEECVLSEVCDMGSGACRDPASVVYVATGGQDGTACGTTSQPCATISDNEGALAKVTDGRRTVRVRSGDYQEAVDINFGQPVAIIGKGARFSPPLSSNLPGVYVRNGSTVVIDGLTVQEATGGSSAHGVRCDSAGVDLQRVELTLNGALGVSASGCTISVSRSLISRNDGGGIRLDDSSFTIRNSMIATNGTFGLGGSIVGGIYIANGGATSSQVIEFNTIVGNNAGDSAPASGVVCTTISAVQARNNIVYAGGGGMARVSGACTWSYSDVQGGANGTGNLDVDPMFVDAANGDFHVMDISPCRDVADPAASLEVDFDGDRRPQGEGRDIGADEVKP